MSQSGFAVLVCNKGINTDKAWRIAWIGSAGSVALLLISIGLFTDEELDASVFFQILFWCAAIFLGFVTTLRVVDVFQESGLSQWEDLSTLYVNERNIEYRNHLIPLSLIVSVTLRIKTMESGHFYGDTNLFRIRTEEREFNLELIISNKNDLVQADKMAWFLKSKNVPVDYECWVTLSI